MFFDDSSPKRRKAANKRDGVKRVVSLANAPLPSPKPYELLQDHELAVDRTLIFDTECFANYWCAAFKCVESSKVIVFDVSPEGYAINGQIVKFTYWATKLAYMLYRFKLIGFNCESYDLPMMQLALKGFTPEQLNAANFRIIDNSMSPFQVRREFDLPYIAVNMIDLIEVAPLQASLKIYAGRLHCPRMQDLPFPPDMELSKSQAHFARDYCVNDLDNTHLLFDSLKPQLALREALGVEYGQDLRSHSDAQIAEAVISSELDKLKTGSPSPFAKFHQKAKIEPGWQFKYKVPDWLAFKTPQLQAVLEAVRGSTFIVGNGGYADVPEALTALEIRLGRCIYRMGGGGLHSSEKCQGYRAGPEMLLIDRDVASYYPAIILNQGLYPEHLGPDFLKVYQQIVTKRLRAKLDKNKVASEGLKITINGTFGKLGNMFSKLYAPDLLMQVTISGQLCLLLFIEMVELAGIPVVSANTDGIVIACPTNRYADLEQVVLTWEAVTGFTTEETRYQSIWSRDVNNYIAVKEPDEKGEVKCKTKGIYSEFGSALNSPLSKNPECQIISDAVQAFLAHNKPLADTIRECKDIRKFVAVRKVNGGAEKDGVYLGKAIRWYYAQGEMGTINYVLSGNNVPKTEGARPLMILPPQIPFDLDHDYYLREAQKALFDLGFSKRPSEASLF